MTGRGMTLPELPDLSDLDAPLSELSPFDLDAMLATPPAAAPVRPPPGRGRAAPVHGRPAPLPAVPLLRSLVWRPSLRSRNTMGYMTVRCWRAGAKAADIAAFRRAKAALDPELISAAAGECATVARKLLSIAPGATVVPVAPGHSKTSERNLAVQVARATAAALGCRFAEAFRPRPVSGVSHPKEFRNLPPLEWQDKPQGPVLLLDDLATSGWHLEEAVTLLREVTAPVSAIAWIGGTVTGE